MQLSELSARSGVAPATVKYYLREGLLPAGERQSATRAEYSPAHVERLRLIRALVDGAGMRIDGVRRVVAALEQPPESRHDLLGVAQEAIDGPVPPVQVTEETRRAVARLGWDGCRADPLAHLQSALDHAERAGVAVTPSRFRAYAEAMLVVARADVAGFDDEPDRLTPAGAVRYVAVGTVVTDPVLAALRRLAQEQVSAERFGNTPEPTSRQDVRTSARS